MGPIVKKAATTTQAEAWSIDMKFVNLLHEQLQRGRPLTVDCTLQLVKKVLKNFDNQP
jgi:hypothetical protein